MASVAAPHIEDTAREVRAQIRFVDPGDFLTRRYVSQGAEINTGTYSDHEVIIRDGMPIRDHFTLEEHGFTIATQPTAVTDFHDKAEVDALYEREVERHVQALTGADKVVARGWMIRTSADLSERAARTAEPIDLAAVAEADRTKENRGAVGIKHDRNASLTANTASGTIGETPPPI